MSRIKGFLSRAMWMFMALLFVVTAVGVSVAIFWQATRPSNQNQNQTQSKLAGKPMPDFTPVADVQSLQKIDQNVGSGAEVKPSSTVTVVYTGAVAATGIVFESSEDSGQPVSFKLDQVIEGWKEGLQGMKAGGSRRLLIPAEQAYGANPPPGSNIPANAALVFDITLLAVQ